MRKGSVNMADTNTNKKVGFFKRISSFFAESKIELKKVTWPTKDQLIHNTGVILVFIIIVGFILSVLDIGFGKLFELLTQVL